VFDATTSTLMRCPLRIQYGLGVSRFYRGNGRGSPRDAVASNAGDSRNLGLNPSWAPPKRGGDEDERPLAGHGTAPILARKPQ